MKQLLCALIVTGCLGSTVHAQTVADYARQERSKRQNQTKSRVITTQMIKSTPPMATNLTPTEPLKPAPAAPATAAPAAPAAKPSASAAPAEPAEVVKDEKWWRSQFAKAREDVKRAEDQVTLLDNYLKTVHRDFLQRSFDPDNSGQRAIAETTTKLDNAKKDLETAQAKVTKLEEEMRTSGAPAGWSR